MPVAEVHGKCAVVLGQRPKSESEVQGCGTIRLSHGVIAPNRVPCCKVRGCRPKLASERSTLDNFLLPSRCAFADPAVHTFLVVGSYDGQQPQQQQQGQAGASGSGSGSPKVGPPPARLPVPPGAAAAAAAPGAAGVARTEQAEQPAGDDDDDDAVPSEVLKLPTMDIFAGCGGLSEGFHQVGGWVGGGVANGDRPFQT